MKKVAADPPPMEEMLKIDRLVHDMPANIGNRTLYAIYCEEGGKVPWKTFRRAVAFCRGGGDAEVEHDRVAAEADAEAKREARVFEMELTRAVKEATVAVEAAAQGAEKMTRREDLSRGQRVFVRVRYADQTKLRPARVNQVMRGAVNVRIDDEDEPRTVRFNEIEIHAPVPTTSPPTIGAVAMADGRVERRAAEPEVTMKRAPPPAPVAVPAPPVAEAPVVTAPVAAPIDAEVNAWIEKGSTMRDNLITKRSMLVVAMDDLVEETLRIEETLAAKKVELARVDALLLALDQMRSVVAA